MQFKGFLNIKYDKGKYWQRAWSLIDGCTPVSDACLNCWLRAMDKRFDRGWDGKVVAREDRLNLPLKTRKPTVFAVWSDLGHEKVPTDFIDNAFRVMCQADWHTYLILSKRIERFKPYAQVYSEWIDKHNIYLGTTVENQKMADKRIPELLKCMPFKLFLSIEPILEKINLAETYNRINWVIIGAESGQNRRECKIEWIESITEQCKNAGVPVFVKQIHKDGKLIKNINQFPEHLRIREFPFAI